MKNSSKRPSMPTTRHAPTRIPSYPQPSPSRGAAPVSDIDPLQEDDLADPVAPPAKAPTTRMARGKHSPPPWVAKGDAQPKHDKNSAQYDPTDPR